VPDRLIVNINDFRYDLPADRIARYPLAERDRSRLLFYDRGMISHHHFTGLPGLLPENSRMVFNDTRVIQARLWFRKPTGARIEVLCVTPHMPADHRQALQATRICTWNCMVGNVKKWKGGALVMGVSVGGRMIHVNASLIEGGEEDFLVEFSWDSSEVTFGEIIATIGMTPLPPYLKRDAEESDRQRYQTVYGTDSGSVAAPTAGLHFTDRLMEQLRERGIRTGRLTLHVGAGTFIPVKTDNPRQHAMHAEQVAVTRGFLEHWLEEPGDIIAVGTTTTRSLESVYWLGVRIAKGIGGDPGPIRLDQWEQETLPGKISLRESLEALIGYCEKNDLAKFRFSTRLMIIPGYRFRTIRGLITNYHLPGSTLLLLIAALIGDDWRDVYREALNNDYRFLSYGDSSLLIP